MMARFIDRYFRHQAHPEARLDRPTFEDALRRLANRKIGLGSVIDVGASNGSWSQALLPYYPKARYLCVEAQRVHEPALRSFVAQHANVEYVLAAAGDRIGQIFFDAGDPVGGTASETRPSATESRFR